jgi:acyl-CoA reductase-like NAD-dependent aldehyde dehydrogenase
MTDRLEVTKTYKLFIDGKFPRSESGRTVPLEDSAGRTLAHACRASRKDLRDAVVAARKALPGWSGTTAYLRAQILYRMAEMLEGKKAEFAAALDQGAARPKGKAARPAGTTEVDAAIDRLVHYAGWADKYAQVLGCNNAVAGPFYNFTVPEPTGVVAVLAPDRPALLALISLIAPPLCAGNTIVALGGEGTAATLAAAILGEVCATSDIPPAVINLLTGLRAELAPVIASHRDIDAIHAAGVDEELGSVLRAGAAENVKRVTVRGDLDWNDTETCHTPWWIEPFVEMKTIWHPSAT